MGLGKHSLIFLGKKKWRIKIICILSHILVFSISRKNTGVVTVKSVYFFLMILQLTSFFLRFVIFLNFITLLYWICTGIQLFIICFQIHNLIRKHFLKCYLKYWLLKSDTVMSFPAPQEAFFLLILRTAHSSRLLDSSREVILIEQYLKSQVCWENSWLIFMWSIHSFLTRSP